MVCHDKEEFISTKEHLLVRYSIHRFCLTMLSLIPKCQTKWVYINSEEYMYWWNWGSNPHVYQTSIKLISLISHYWSRSRFQIFNIMVGYNWSNHHLFYPYKPSWSDREFNDIDIGKDMSMKFRSWIFLLIIKYCSSSIHFQR